REVEKLYSFLSAPSFVVRTAEAELLKYAANAFHATKITFANEIGRVANRWGINGSVVMDLLSQDTVLNISSAYLRPGFAYGGSCLPKDLRALVSRAHVTNVPVPLLESLSRSNRLQIDSAYDLIARLTKNRERTIGFLGLAFKAGTDDLRESPMVELVERLLGKGYRLLLYDESVSLPALMGSNKEFIEQEIPHLADLITDDIHRVLRESQVLVVSRTGESYANALQEVNRQAIIINLHDDLTDGKNVRTLVNSNNRRRRSMDYDARRRLRTERIEGVSY
ncbi:MAG TPA: UDP binding domain-containing protein, partial [Candidatus Binatia bacterium]|nr:UDP binding domain-containing protein [Candidatus Binatia bacterium]